MVNGVQCMFICGKIKMKARFDILALLDILLC